MSSEEQKMQAKKLYNEAMEKGYAECSTIRCLIHGSAGVGKTHVKHLLLKMPPPKLRTSTGIADNPVRAVTVSALGVSKQDEDDWHVLDGDYDLMHAVSQMIKGYVEPLPKKDDPPMVQPTSHSSHPGPSANGYAEDGSMLFSSFPSNHTHDVIVPPDEHHMYSHQPLMLGLLLPIPLNQAMPQTNCLWKSTLSILLTSLQVGNEIEYIIRCNQSLIACCIVHIQVRRNI